MTHLFQTGWRRAGATALFALALPPLAAQTPAPARPRIAEVTVTATPLPDIVEPALVLTADDLLTRRAPSLGETLDREPGISSSWFGPAASRPVIRGLAGSRVTVLTDSVSTLDVSDVSPDHAVTTEPLLADSIEIVRGPLALFYGSAAAGGVVNVLDSRVPRTLPERSVTGAVEVRGDSALGEQSLVGRLDGGTGGVAWHLDGFARETDDIEIPGFATADPDERDPDERRGRLANSASESDGFAGGASWVGERGYVGLAWSALDATYGLPGPGEEEGDEEEPPIFPGPFLDLEQRRIDLRSEYRIGGLLESVRVAAGYNDYQHTEIEPSGEPATRFDNEAWQARVELRHAAVAGFQGALGVQYDDREFSAIGEEAFVAPTDTRAIGLFLAEQREFAWGQLQLGARLEDLEHSPAADLPDYDELALSLAAGAAIDVRDDLRLKLNLARTERNPAAEELYSDGPHLATRLFEVGLLAAGASVDKEVSLNLDVGLEGGSDVLSWSVTGFFNDIDDFVFLEPTGNEEDGLPEAVYTQDDARFWGGEAELRVSLPVVAGFTPSVRTFADFVRAERSGGRDLPRIPPWRFGLGVAAERGPWRVAADATYHADQDDVTSFATDSFTLVSVDASWAPRLGSLDWQFFVRGANLADEEARRSASFLAGFAPLPGRSLQGGVRIAF